MQFVPKGAVNYKAILVQVKAWHREDTKPLLVSDDLGQWCIYESIGLIELITSPYWENISMQRKTVLFGNTRDTFTPIAEVGNSDPSGWVVARDGLTVFCKIPIKVRAFLDTPY